MKPTKFRHKCPKCQTENKVVRRCLKCGCYSCVICSIGRLCIDCYMDDQIAETNEIRAYMEDKYHVIA